jgi:hypothetical protein
MWSSEVGHEPGAARRECIIGAEGKLTNLIQLHQKVLCALFVEQRLGGLAVGTVGL